MVTRLEELMRRLLGPTTYLAAALVVGACAGGSASSPNAIASPVAAVSQVPSPIASAESASPSSTTAPATSATPTAFTSKTYGYTMTVPADWTTGQAFMAWDGKGMPGHDVAEADKFVSPNTASAWLLSAPTKKDLAGQVKQAITANATDHGDTCPPVPASQEPIKIGSEPGALLSWNCGILINVGVTVHDGVAYMFGFRDPAIHAATDPVDRADFLALLESVKFPG
jgi:hypothetical protein